ncbi:MAG: serine hydrolase, partial [Oscillibacter sp.]|nr:serine hydrolase [Oscillibacter sp.]
MGAKEQILEGIQKFEGQAGIYYRNLETGEAWGYREKEPYLAASIVKLPLMAAILHWRAQGRTSFDEPVTILDSQKVPG